MRLAKVTNIHTGVDFDLPVEDYEVFKKEFIFHKYIEVELDKKPKPVAVRDINQMNKTALLEVCTKLGIEATDKMTNKALKDSINDFRARKEDIVEI